LINLINKTNPQGKSCFEGLLVEKGKHFSMKSSYRIMLIMSLLVAALFSCSNDMEVLKKFIDEEIEPDVVGIRVEVLHSDSARLIMKLVTPLFKEFNSAKERRQEFPEGVHVWLYEITGELRAEITANRARHDLETGVIEANGNVVVIDAEGKKLETEQLFFDQKKGEVYSNKYTKMTKDGSYEGSGESFWAKQDFSVYRFSNRSGVGRTTIYYTEDNE